MKLKYKFVVRTIDNHPVAVAVGKDNAYFRGMIKLNDTGGFIFRMLSDDITAIEIARGLCKEYDVPEDEALRSVNEFIDGLKDSGLIED